MLSVKCLLSSHSLTIGSILESEWRQRLKLIQRRLPGRVAILRPYYAEIHRQIPYCIVHAMSQVIQLGHFREPLCYSSKNKKAHVISFTSQKSVVLFFGLLPSMRESELGTSLMRRLKGLKRNGHLVKVLVDEQKIFCFCIQI